MATFFDYLIWRGDILFSERPFNEVDNLIFSEMAYFNFGQVTAETGTTLYAAYEVYQKLEEPTGYNVNNPVALFIAAANSKRFYNVTAERFVNILDKERQIQFCAVTFRLPDGTLYVAFRGTDSTIVGWREDFNLSYMDETPAQGEAVKYLEDVIRNTEGLVRVGGHSKGGNLAVYAAAFCDPALRDRIVAVYSNDGPGFTKTNIEREGFKEMLPKLLHYIPEASIVGTLFSHEKDSIIIKSDGKNAADQHFAEKWQIERDHFVRGEKQTKVSSVLDDTVDKWMNGLSLEERKTLVDTIFDTLEGLDAETMAELTRNKWTAIPGFIKGLAGQEADVRKTVMDTVVKLAKSGKKVLMKEE